ncbi:MAG TPA: helix-turn-helix transcriptional regulator [Acidimicrobiales bacterium]|nr:helix-turn-helix transcriptional regulator [Acidimicrobiales bacterium]
METKLSLGTEDYVRQLENHLESALFEAGRVREDPDGAVILVQSAIAVGERERAQALVARLEKGAAAHPHSARLAGATSYCRTLLQRDSARPPAPAQPPARTIAPLVPLALVPARAPSPGSAAGQRLSFGWDSLTGTEYRVAALVALGLTNRQVAREAFMSRHTVDSHLRHIFRKLGIGSRVQLARLVVERGPAGGQPSPWQRPPGAA